MVLGQGPNAAVRHWGGLLAERYHKNNSEAKDFTTTHLGYDTDNGAFYYCEWACGRKLVHKRWCAALNVKAVRWESLFLATTDL